VLDGARRRSGLALTAEVEFQERHEVDQRNAQVTAGATSGWQLCRAADCNVSPVNSAGAPVPTPARRWFCPAHVDQAQPGDLDERPFPLRRSLSGALVEYDPDEEAREAARAASRAAQPEAQRAERQLEAEELAATQRALDERFRRESAI
jgi:hypothetical protein